MWMLNQGAPKGVRLRSFASAAAGGTYENGATVGWALRNTADSADLATGSLAQVSGTDGLYEGTIPATATSGLTIGAQHYLIVTVTLSAVVIDRRKILCTVQLREGL